MRYLKDTMTGAVRRFNENIPKEARKYKVFMKAKKYSYDSDENTILASPGRWEPTTVKAYNNWAKIVDAESKEVE